MIIQAEPNGGRTMADRVTEYLVDDHVRLHALLRRAVTPQGDIEPDAYAAFRAGLLRHIGIEEKVLLPAARRARSGVAIERARDLRLEHAALTSLLVPTPDAALCGEVLWLLHSHDDKEEGPTGVYAECEALFSDEESRALAARAEAFPQVPVAPHYDGPEALRTAATALAGARRMKAMQK